MTFRDFDMGADKDGIGEKEYVDERCELCDSHCERKISLNTWKCSVCSWLSTGATVPATIDFRVFDDRVGKRGGRSELQKKVHWYRENYWQKILLDRRQQILDNQDKLSPSYRSRMDIFFRFNLSKKMLKEKREQVEAEIERERQIEEEAERERQKKIEYALGEAKRKRNQEIAEALDLSDFKALLPYHLDGEQRVTEELIELLQNFRSNKSDEFNDIAKFIGSEAKKIKDDTQFLDEFFLTLLRTYPESLGITRPGFNHWMKKSSGVILSTIIELNLEEFRRLLDSLPPTPKWEKSTLVKFAELLISNDSVNEKNPTLLVLDKLPFIELQGDSLFSYVVRKNNQSLKKERSHSAGLVRLIEDEDRRVLSILSMSPADFAEYVSHEDFSTIINSPLYSLILSVDQVRYVLNGDSGRDYRLQIKEVIDKLPENSGSFLTSISTDFRKALGEETGSSGEYYTLQNSRIQSWDYYDERVLQLVGDDIVAKKITHYYKKSLNKMDKVVWKSYSSFSKLGNPIDDPYRIARCITDFDYSFSEEVRIHLDSLLMK